MLQQNTDNRDTRHATTTEQKLVKRFKNSHEKKSMIPRIVKMGVLSECYYRVLEVIEEIKADKNFNLGCGNADQRRMYHATKRFADAEEGENPTNHELSIKGTVGEPDSNS